MFGGTFGYGDSYMEFFFRHFKFFRTRAILHDAIGAVRAQTTNDPVYCCMFGRGSNSFFFGHVTGLLFCFYIKLFPPSIFNSVDFWCFMICLVLDFELVYINFKKELGVSFYGKVQGYSFHPPESTNPKSSIDAQDTCTGLGGLKDVWITVSLQLTSLEIWSVIFFAKRDFHGNWLHEEVENFVDQGCRKIRDLVDAEADVEIWTCSSYPVRHKNTHHCAELKTQVLGNLTMQHLKL